MSHELTPTLSDFKLFFNSMEWPYYQKYVSQITLNHTTCYYVVLLMSEVFVQILLDVNLLLNQTLLAFLQYKSNLDVSVDSGNFSVRHYLPWVCILCEGGTSFGWDSSTSRKLSQFLFMFLTGFTSCNVLRTSFSSISHLLHLCGVFVAVSSDIDKVPSISLSTNINTFETLTFILRTGQPILVELIELVNSVIKLFIANLTQIVNWLTNGELSHTYSGFSK